MLAHAERERRRYEDGLARLPAAGAPRRERQLVRVANAAYGAGLALLAAGEPEEARTWFRRAAEHYRETCRDRSWGRRIAVLKALLLAGDDAAADAEATLEGADAASAIGRYAACLALLVLARDDEAAALAKGLREDDFPPAVAAALLALAAGDAASYADAIRAVLRSFEERADHLEGVPVADTVLVLERLAAARGMAQGLSSPLLP